MNRKLKEYKSRADRIVRTFIALGISIFILGILLSIIYYMVNKPNMDKSQIADEVTAEDYKNSETGITYYVSANGDSEDGTDINNPMSLETANAKTYNGNDKVLFKCGDIFYGYISFNINTINDDFFYIGSYGEGEKPIISGGEIIGDLWNLYENDIYTVDLSDKTNIKGYQSSSYNIGFLADNSGNIYGNRKRTIDLLSEEMDFYVKGSTLYLKCSENPYEKYEELILTTQKSLLAVSSNTMVENLNLQYTGAHGILHKNKITNNVCIRNCIIQNIGGSVQVSESFTRYGNGIEFWNQASNTLIENCIIRNIYDAGYTVQGSEVTEELGFNKNICRNNIFINCTYDIEMFCRNDSNSKEICDLKDQIIYNNISINQGHNWGYEIRPSKISAANFVVWNIQEKNTDVTFMNNKYFNPRRLNYIYKAITPTLFKDSISSNNNTFYLNQGTYLINNEGSYTDKSMLETYNIEQESAFNLLSEEEQEIINNSYIIHSNDYNKIKSYYEFLDGAKYQNKIEIATLTGYQYQKDNEKVILLYGEENNSIIIPYTNFIAKDLYGKTIENLNGSLTLTEEPILIYNFDESYSYNTIATEVVESCNEFIQKYSTQLVTSTNMRGVKTQLELLKTEINKIPTYMTVIETSTAVNLLETIFKQGDTIITSFKAKKITTTYEEILEMMIDLYQICNGLEKLCETSKGTIPNLAYNTNNIQLNIDSFDSLYRYYEEELSSVNKIAIMAKENYKNISSSNEYVKIFSIVSANYLTNWANRILNLYAEDYINSNPVTITYSNTRITNQSVTATLQTSADITVTNNANSKTYTFAQNGSFTFEYTIKGQAFKLTATVNNIDKTAPTITGIQNDKLYLDSVIPQIQDQNLKEVKLHKDGNLVGNYQTNSSISEDGYYKLIATDQANNQTQVEFYISRNPASITYSTTQWTNQDVTATITSSFEVEVMNNSNNVMHRFTQNGEFKFNIKIKETEIELIASVNNIDKTPPSITGVEQNGQYISRVTPMAIDENLQKVELYLNSEKVNNYVPNTEITEEGFYKIVATDKAGNETIVEFMVIENISKEYKLQDHYILNIENNTQKENFKTKLNLTIQYEILRDGNPLAETDILATGDILKTSTGEEYTLVVNGDINKDGDVNIKDVIRLRKYLLERNNLDETELMAADCNLDGKTISIKDLIRMRILLLQRDVT